MKYIVKVCGPSLIPHYVSGITTIRVQGFKKVRNVKTTLKISQATVYDDMSAASSITKLILAKNSLVSISDAEVVNVPDKELFKAKLENK